MDIVNKKTRSKMMASIRGRNTTPEIDVRKHLFQNGFRYRLHVKQLPGCPDLVLKKYQVLIFVHGCFWHQHKRCKYAVMPKSNTGFWKEKLLKNRERDRTNILKLKKSGWRVLTVWECSLRTQKLKSQAGDKIIRWILSGRGSGEIPSK